MHMKTSRSFIGLLALLFWLPMQAAWAATCLYASPGANQWRNTPVQSQSGQFQTVVNARPTQANSDTLFGFAQGAQTHWSRLAVIVRFNNTGTIDVRRGSTYAADSVVAYTANTTYRFRLEVNVPAHTYSVYVSDATGGPEQLLARDYAFRTEQQSVTSLDHFIAEAEIGDIEACIDTFGACKTAAPGAQQWQNTEMRPSVSTVSPYTAMFEVTPLAANMDGLLALSQGPKRHWSGLAAIVRFNSSGTIDVRNGDRYMADQVVAYVPNTKYTVEIHTGSSGYTVYVAGPDRVRRSIAHNYALRTEQQGVRVLDNWVLEAELGSIKGCFLTAFD